MSYYTKNPHYRGISEDEARATDNIRSLAPIRKEAIRYNQEWAEKNIGYISDIKDFNERIEEAVDLALSVELQVCYEVFGIQDTHRYLQQGGVS